MDLVDQLAKLQQLKESGALNDEEFQLAKHRLLQEENTPPPAPVHDGTLLETIEEIGEESSSLGVAANRYVTYQYKSHLIGAVVAIIIFLLFALIFMSAKSDMDQKFNGFHTQFQSFP